MGTKFIADVTLDVNTVSVTDLELVELFDTERKIYTFYSSTAIDDRESLNYVDDFNIKNHVEVYYDYTIRTIKAEYASLLSTESSTTSASETYYDVMNLPDNAMSIVGIYEGQSLDETDINSITQDTIISDHELSVSLVEQDPSSEGSTADHLYASYLSDIFGLWQSVMEEVVFTGVGSTASGTGETGLDDLIKFRDSVIIPSIDDNEQNGLAEKFGSNDSSFSVSSSLDNLYTDFYEDFNAGINFAESSFKTAMSKELSDVSLAGIGGESIAGVTLREDLLSVSNATTSGGGGSY